MINSWCTDVEIFPNLFSIGFVNLRDYLNIFKDCVDNKGHPIPMTECLTVAEIKSRLDKVEKRKYYISDTNDSQLLEIVAFINGMEARYETKTTKDGNVTQEAIRWDIYGFNIQGYDDLMIKTFLMNFNRFDNTKELIMYLYKISKKIIDLQNDKNAFYEDKELDLIRHYRLPYKTVDVQKIFALHSAGVNIDKESGKRIKFAKSLKQTSINLKWYQLLDFKLPPIDEEEYNNYWRKQKGTYSLLSLDELNKIITTDFDRYVLPKYVEHMLDYNFNDIYIVAEMVRLKPDEVKLRYSLSAAFKLDLLCCSRANIADKLLVKFYSEMSGLHKSKFEKLRTERTRLSFNKVIFPHIKFKTKQLQDVLNEMKQISIYRTSKDSFEKKIDFYGTTYTLATGGIHSVDVPGVLKSDDKYVYVHYDIGSYYPSIMVAYKIAPKHLNQKVFVKMVDYFRLTRLDCKHTSDEVKMLISGVPNKLSAEALKIVINAIYGKFGSDTFWLYDRLAQLQVTINGQSMTMMVVEALELAGIHVISANTDGIIVKLPRDKEEEFKQITDEWCRSNKMTADSERYKLFVKRDVNNYLDVQETKKGDAYEFKGALDPKQYLKDLKKGFDMPIVAKAIYEYFVNNIPIMTTLKNHKDILDFCKTQNVGKQFEVVYDKVENNKIISIHSQRHVRFYVSNRGVIIQKENNSTGARSKLASGKPVIILNTLDDKPIEERNIDYGYYYNECYKIIDPIMLKVSPNMKGDAQLRTKSGKVIIKKYSHQYNRLFDDDEDIENN